MSELKGRRGVSYPMNMNSGESVGDSAVGEDAARESAAGPAVRAMTSARLREIEHSDGAAPQTPEVSDMARIGVAAKAAEAAELAKQTDAAAAKALAAEALLAAAVKPAERIVCWTRVKSRRLVNSFYYAFAGLSFLFRTQRNARIHAVMATLACGLGLWLGISRVEWAVIIFTIALVLILEGLNTAVEAAVDLASPQRHPLAKAAKDLAAGMVLIAAIASVGVGVLILGPPLWAKLSGR